MIGPNKDKSYLIGQGRGTNLFYIIVGLGVAGILGSVGFSVHDANQREEEFLRKLRNSRRLEYTTKHRDTLNTISSCEGLTLEQRELYKSYLVQLYPELEKNVPSGDTPQRFLLPDYNGDTKVGCQK